MYSLKAASDLCRLCSHRVTGLSTSDRCPTSFLRAMINHYHWDNSSSTGAYKQTRPPKTSGTQSGTSGSETANEQQGKDKPQEGGTAPDNDRSGSDDGDKDENDDDDDDDEEKDGDEEMGEEEPDHDLWVCYYCGNGLWNSAMDLHCPTCGRLRADCSVTEYSGYYRRQSDLRQEVVEEEGEEDPEEMEDDDHENA